MYLIGNSSKNSYLLEELDQNSSEQTACSYTCLKMDKGKNIFWGNW